MSLRWTLGKAAWLPVACVAFACGGGSAGPPSPDVGGQGGVVDSIPPEAGAGGVDDADIVGGAAAGGTSGETAAPNSLRIELSPPGLLLTPGATATVTAEVIGGSVAVGALRWETIGSAVTLSAGPNQTATVVAGSEIDSVQIVAHVGERASAPLTVAVAELSAQARLLRDDEVLSEPEPVDDAQPGGPGSRVHVSLAGDPPPRGQILVGSGKPVEGKVLSSSKVKGGNDVVLEVVPLDEALARLRVEQSYDASRLSPQFPAGEPADSSENDDGSITYEFPMEIPDYEPPAERGLPRVLGLGETSFRLGPMFCATAASAAPSISRSQVVTTVTTHLRSIDAEMSIEPSETRFKLVASGSIEAHVEGPFRLNSAFSGSLLCQAPLVVVPVPVIPVIAAVFTPTLVAGARLSASGKLSIDDLELKVDAKVTQPVALGLEIGSDGTFEDLSEVDFSKVETEITCELRSTSLDSPGRVESEIRSAPFVQAAVTNAVFAFVRVSQDKYPYLSLLDLEAGLKASLRLGTVADQINDPAFAAGYDIDFHARFGLGEDAAEAVSWFSKLLALGSKVITLPEAAHDDLLFSSPIGEARTSLTSYTHGDHVHFSVALDPDFVAPPLLGYYNVKSVEIWRKNQDGGAEKLIGRGATEGEHDFSFDWTADRSGVTQDNVFAVVEPFFGEGFELEIGPVAGWAGTQQYGGAGDNSARAPSVDAQGNVAFVGYTFDGVDHFTKPGGADVVWTKLDPTGKVLARTLFGGAGDDYPLAMALSADGYYYVAGFSTGGDLSGEGAPVQRDPSWSSRAADVDSYAWLAKLDPDGKQLWAHQWVERLQELASSIAIGPTGTIYVGGNTGVGRLVANNQCGNVVETVYPVNNPVETAKDCGDVVLSAFNPGGVVLYHKVDVARSWQDFPNIALDPSGNALALVTSTWGNIQSDDPLQQAFGNPVGTEAGSLVYKPGAGVWIFDPASGDVRTRRYIELAEQDLYAQAVAYDDDSKLFIAGSTSGAFDGFTNQGGTDLFLMQVDGGSTVEMFGSPGNDAARGLRFGAKGEIFLLGNTTGSLPGATAKGGTDVGLLHLAPDGSLLSTSQIGASGDDFADGIAIDALGDVFICGRTTSKLGSAANGGLDQFVAKLGPSGVLQ